MTSYFQAPDTFSKTHHFWCPFVNFQGCDVLMFSICRSFFCRSFSLLHRCLQVFWLHRSTLNAVKAPPDVCHWENVKIPTKNTTGTNSPHWTCSLKQLGVKSLWWGWKQLYLSDELWTSSTPTKHPDLYKWWSHLGDDASFWNPHKWHFRLSMSHGLWATMTLTSWMVWIIIPTRKWWSYSDAPSIFIHTVDWWKKSCTTWNDAYLTISKGFKSSNCCYPKLVANWTISKNPRVVPPGLKKPVRSRGDDDYEVEDWCRCRCRCRCKNHGRHVCTYPESLKNQNTTSRANQVENPPVVRKKFPVRRWIHRKIQGPILSQLAVAHSSIFTGVQAAPCICRFRRSMWWCWKNKNTCIYII